MATQQFDITPATASSEMDEDHDQPSRSEKDVSQLSLPDLSISTSRTQKTFRQLTLPTGTQINPADTFSILVASDVHMGYADRDEVRKMDSFNSFEEVLRIATERKVDFVLLGGDLFHENKPSRFTAKQCASLLRTYCMGENKINFQLISDPLVNFAHMEEHFRRVNTDDPDLKISLPVYSIHGNHDDPSGLKYLSELDLLHTYGLINYFGKANDVENIDIEPLLFTKGKTKLAIYGLGSIRDERLHRAYLAKSVKMKRPDSPEDWFSVFLLHQNRPAHRGTTNFIPESFLEDWLDLVIWGHEHDPIPVPELNREKGFEVLQPGSTVATSMSDGEGKQKFCYVLNVCGNKYKVEPIPLDTVRPFYIEEVEMAQDGFLQTDENHNTLRFDVEKYLSEKVEHLITRAERERKPNQPKEPLVRLRVDFGNVDPLNPILFGQKFVGRVANPRDIILPVKQKVATQPNGQSNGHHEGTMVKNKTVVVLDTTTIEDLVVQQFGDHSDELSVFDPKLLSEALRIFVHSDDKDVITDVYNYQKTKAQSYLDEHGDININDTKHLGDGLRSFRETYDENTGKFMADFRGWRSTKALHRPAPVTKVSIVVPKAVVTASSGAMRPANGVSRVAKVATPTQRQPTDTITIDEDDGDANINSYLPASNPPTSTFPSGRLRTVITSSNSKRPAESMITPPAKRARARPPARGAR